MYIFVHYSCSMIFVEEDEDEGILGTIPPCSPSTFNVTYYNYLNYFMHAVGIIVNILTIVVISKFKVITRAHKLMAVLAMADIGQCISLLFHIPKQNQYVQCYYDIWIKICYVEMIFFESMVAFSAYVYLMLTIDRFVAVVWALQYKTIMTKKKYVIYTILLLTHHFIAFLLSYMFFPNEYLWAKKLLCKRNCESVNFIHPFARYYMLAFITMLVILNIVLCVVLVIYLFITRKRRRSLSGADGGSDGLSKATNTLIFISTLYALLYVQLMVIGFVSAFAPLNVYKSYPADSIYYLNNNINPFVYYIRMPDFREGFHKLIRCERKHQK